MAVRSREELMSSLNAILGENASNEALAILEDVSDTYNDLNQRANPDGVNWEERYEELDNEWRERYRQRFNEPYTDDNNNNNDNNDNNNNNDNHSGRLTFESLFKEE